MYSPGQAGSGSCTVRVSPGPVHVQSGSGREILGALAGGAVSASIPPVLAPPARPDSKPLPSLRTANRSRRRRRRAPSLRGDRRRTTQIGPHPATALAGLSSAHPVEPPFPERAPNTPNKGLEHWQRGHRPSSGCWGAGPGWPVSGRPYTGFPSPPMDGPSPGRPDPMRLRAGHPSHAGERAVNRHVQRPPP